jgi:uncharacterized protein
MPAEVGTYLILCAFAFTAGAMNSVAGGGTLLTFPALMAAFAPFGPQAGAFANATSTVALLPGSFAGAWGYRTELGDSRPFVRRMLAPSLAGGLVGSVLLAAFPQQFTALVPWLVLTAAVLFLIQPVLLKVVRRWQKEPHGPPSPAMVVGLQFGQFLIAVYGGYFGAGIGILMLAALGLMGMDHIHRMNGVKNFAAMCINGVAAAAFIMGGAVNWPLALLMVVGAILGGYGGARAARRLGPKVVRRMVIGIGLAIGCSMLIQRLAVRANARPERSPEPVRSASAANVASPAGVKVSRRF